jgi:hypothetical protein
MSGKMECMVWQGYTILGNGEDLDSGSFPTIPNAFRQRPFPSIITHSAFSIEDTYIFMTFRELEK